MRAHRSIPLVALALALSGCFGTVRGRVSYGATVTADVRVPAEVIVSTPPPPIRAEVETVTAQPVPHAVWVSGHYEWRGRWVWVPGHWEHDREGYVWVAPVARRHGNRIIYHAGYWVRVGHEPPRVYREPSVIVVAAPPPAGVVVRPGRRPPPVVQPVRPRPPVVVQPAPRPPVVVQPAPRPPVVVQPAPRPPVVVQPAPVQPTRPPVVQPEPVRPPVVVRPAPAPRPPVVRPEPVQPPRGAVVVRPSPQENPEPPRGAVVIRPEPAQPPRAAVQPPAQPVGPAPPRGPIVRPPPAQTAPVPPNANVQVVPPRTPTVRGPAGQEGPAVAPPRVAPVPAQTGSITCAVDAASAPQGGIVEITGTGFGASARVRIAGRLVRTVQQSEGRILVRVPDQIGGGRVTIVDGDRTGSCGVISLR